METPRWNVNIRPIEQRDVESVVAIQSASPEVAQWTAWDYSRVAHGEMTGWVVEEAGREILGFLIARSVGTDLEILNLAVRPDVRKSGIGGKLLDCALAWGAEKRAEKAFLEVRASNIAAVQFYEHRGFDVIGRRPRYYVSPVEDALLLTASIRYSAG